jgi:hypothetical protein
MSFDMSDITLPVASKGDRPYFMDDKDAEKVMNMVLALTGELSVVYSRLYALERVLEKNNLIAQNLVNEYRMTDSDATTLDAWRNTLIKTVLRPIHAEMQRNAQPDAKENYDKVIELTEN